MKRAFIPYPHKVLKTPAKPVDAITDDIRAIWADMVETMDAMPGYGLAAPQIGVGLTLAVVDCSDSRGQAILLANPQVLHASVQPRDHDEASPNLPGVSAVITRPRAVTVRYLNADGMVEDRDFVNLWATSVQHQIDHLAGKMYFDRLSPLKRKMLLAKAEKLRAIERMGRA
ncbi:peptide deformylase [Fertoebacter nigrum]|uniref:Peptide deformylase-like n=1 Tax=Fertoeibacter niger TaxID=2656921 RepID=A0A8X8H0P6_9RHOB|nr:peptide deformylase [Fertoeibacter niger]NUB46647.1 peptide deformylase [Fertoeibacter niger]